MKYDDYERCLAEDLAEAYQKWLLAPVEAVKNTMPVKTFDNEIDRASKIGFEAGYRTAVAMLGEIRHVSD